MNSNSCPLTISEQGNCWPLESTSYSGNLANVGFDEDMAILPVESQLMVIPITHFERELQDLLDAFLNARNRKICFFGSEVYTTFLSETQNSMC